MPQTTPARTLPGLTPAALIGGYVVLALLPLILVWLGDGPSQPFLRRLSSGLVMVGFALMLVQFILSGRFNQVSGKVGIDVTMRFHQLAAWMVLAFIVVHPLLYAAGRLPQDPAGAWNMLIAMFTSPGLRTGAIAWFLLVLLVLMAVFRDRLPMRYELWRLSHGVGAAVIALFALEHTIAVGSHSRDGILMWFWIIMTFGAVGSLAYVYGVKPFIKRGRPYRVVSNSRIADRIWEVVTEPEDPNARIPVHSAGQFAWLNLGHAPFSLTEHPFSISSAPADGPRISFTIKESGDFTNRIGSVKPGTRAYLDGPYGSFTPTGYDHRGIVLIGGGVGFAPVIGILRQLRAERYPHPVHLVYGNRVETQIMYRSELEAAQDDLDLNVHLIVSEPEKDWQGPVGELTPDVLRMCLQDAINADYLYFVCGPTGMMTAVEEALAELGVPPARIVSERFKYD
jgi:predicted ferric reductase